MGLQRALAALSDSRDGALQAHRVIGFLDKHAGEPVGVARISRATGVSAESVERVLKALVDAFVLDFGGESAPQEWVYRPSPVTALEVSRYLRTGNGSAAQLQRGIDRFRNRQGRE